MFQSYSNLHTSCILVSIIKFQNQFTWKNSVSSLKNPATHRYAVDPAEMTILTRSFMKNVPIFFKFTHKLHFSIHYEIPESVYLEKFCVKFVKSSHPPLMRQIQKWPFSCEATWKMFQFYWNLHISCILSCDLIHLAKNQEKLLKSRENAKKLVIPAYFRHFRPEKIFSKIRLGHVLSIPKTHLWAKKSGKTNDETSRK